MKLWIKYLIGIVIGAIAAFLLPIDTKLAQTNLNFVVDLIVRFGRYAVLPVIFFSVIMAVFKLYEEKLMLKTTLWTVGTILFTSVLLVAVGILSATIIYLPRIPITIEKVNETPTLGLRTMLQQIFPYNGMQTLIDGAFILPGMIFAGLAGYGAWTDKKGSAQALTVIDSISHICYQVMSFITELISVGLIAIMFKWTVSFIHLSKLSVYNPLFLLFLCDLILVAVFIYPVLIRIICRERHPYRILYASISSFLVAFLSGDTNLTLGVNMRIGKENLGIRRRTNAIVMPLFSVFGRGGAALVESVCFILILRSYSSLNITLSSVLWISLMSFLLSFVLGNIPSGGPFFAITLMFNMYGGGFDAGYLLLKEAAPLICCFAAGFDAITALFGSYIVASKTGMLEKKEAARFI